MQEFARKLAVGNIPTAQTCLNSAIIQNLFRIDDVSRIRVKGRQHIFACLIIAGKFWRAIFYKENLSICSKEPFVSGGCIVSAFECRPTSGHLKVSCLFDPSSLVYLDSHLTAFQCAAEEYERSIVDGYHGGRPKVRPLPVTIITQIVLVGMDRINVFCAAALNIAGMKSAVTGQGQQMAVIAGEYCFAKPQVRGQTTGYITSFQIYCDEIFFQRNNSNGITDKPGRNQRLFRGCAREGKTQ